MHKTFSLLILLFFSSSLLSAQELTIPADIYELKSFGHWETIDQHGHLRIVIINQGFEHVASSVFLEWISVQEDGLETYKSVPITEINEFRLYSVGVKKVEWERLILSLTQVYSLEESELEIIPLVPGKYEAKAV